MKASTEPTHVLKRPIVTEKSTWEANAPIKNGKRAGETTNRYTFEVPMDARKPEIKSAVETLYGVRVDRVATQVRKGKYFRNRFGTGKTSNWKKAVVTLHPEDRIELF